MRQSINKAGSQLIVLSLALLWAAISVPLAHAHGTAITIEPNGHTLTVMAQFDTGDPMQEAQLIVYAPDDPQKAWHKGITSKTGLYSFDINPELVGKWSINVRTAGHGEWQYMTVTDDGTINVDSRYTQPTWIKWSIATMVVAGFIGIAIWSQQRQANPQRNS